MSTRPKALSVTSPKAWQVLVSPVRSEITEALRLLGPCSIADVAAAIDRPADTLYAHIKLLIRAGFIAESGYRKNGRHIEQLIDVVADDFVVEFKDNTGKAENQAIVATANSFLSAAARAVRDSAAARALEFTPDTRNISINYELSWLTPERFQEVRALIRRLKSIMDEGKSKREGRLYLTLAIATPVTRKRGARRSEPPAAQPRRAGRTAKPLTVRRTNSSESQAQN